MIKKDLVGFIVGFVIIAVAYCGRDQLLASNIDKGEVSCTARLKQVTIVKYTIGGRIEPECESKDTDKLLPSYTFASSGSIPKDGDPLTCRVTKHNAWFFSWDVGWFNDSSYSYDNCTIAQ